VHWSTLQIPWPSFKNQTTQRHPLLNDHPPFYPPAPPSRPLSAFPTPPRKVTTPIPTLKRRWLYDQPPNKQTPTTPKTPPTKKYKPPPRTPHNWYCAEGHPFNPKTLSRGKPYKPGPVASSCRKPSRGLLFSHVSPPPSLSKQPPNRCPLPQVVWREWLLRDVPCRITLAFRLLTELSSLPPPPSFRVPPRPVS